MGQAPPKALFVTPVLPSPTGMGLAMRAGSQLMGLRRICDVTTLLVPLIATAETEADFAAHYRGVPLVRLPLAGQADPFFRIIASLGDPAERLSLFARYGKPSLAAAVSAEVARQVAEQVAHAGATHVHVFRSYLLPALDQLPAGVARSIDLDEDDVASFLSSATVLAARRETMAAEWARLEAQGFARLMAQKLAGFAAVSLANADDIPALLARHPGLPLRAVRNGVPLPPRFSLARHARGRDMLFVGSLRYAPNVDGLRWFIDEVLPRIPDARLVVAGRAPPRELLVQARPGRVTFLGYVREIGDAYRRAALAIAPMRSGGGTRLKILEAGAHGVAVVATPEAASGLWKQGRIWGMTASDPRRFAAACRRLLDQRCEARRLGLTGRHVVAARFGTAAAEGEWARMFEDVQKGPGA